MQSRVHKPAWANISAFINLPGKGELLARRSGRKAPPPAAEIERWQTGPAQFRRHRVDMKFVMGLRKFSGNGARILIILLAVPPSIGSAQNSGIARNVLTDRDVVTLANAGFSEAFILRTIGTSPTKFDLTADALADLAKNGITEAIVQAMRNLAAKSDSTPPETRTPRVFVEQSASAFCPSHSHPQSVEIMKTFAETCPAFTVTDRREDAAFVVLLEHESGKWIGRDNKMVVFDRSGDLIFATSTRGLGSAVRNFCQAARMVSAVAATH